MERLAIIVIIVGGGIVTYEVIRLLPSLWRSAMLWLFGDRKGY